ncbi:MAG TPA: exodeoxyribonuclease VII small subunit [Verrucomicrobiae bacterium]|nr:exodeoxyribonuclease VII small subunit [Verrucomicrobiae bacterium]
MSANKATKSTKPSKKSYQELEAELRDIIAWFESDSFDVDQALVRYKRGLELLGELEAYLKTAENTVRKLQADVKATLK